MRKSRSANWGAWMRSKIAGTAAQPVAPSAASPGAHGATHARTAPAINNRTLRIESASPTKGRISSSSPIKKAAVSIATDRRHCPPTQDLQTRTKVITVGDDQARRRPGRRKPAPSCPAPARRQRANLHPTPTCFQTELSTPYSPRHSQCLDYRLHFRVVRRLRHST